MIVSDSDDDAFCKEENSIGNEVGGGRGWANWR